MKSKVYQITAQSRSFTYESGLMGKFENFLVSSPKRAVISSGRQYPLHTLKTTGPLS